MASEVRRYDVPPSPPPDEGYWAALLEEAELAMGGLPQQAKDDALAEDEMFSPPYSDDLDAYEARSFGTLADWEQVEQVNHSDTTVNLKVVGYNRGGLLVEWGTLHGFVPASQLVGFPIEHDNPANRREALSEYVGKMLHLRVIELDRVQSRLILSERAAEVPPGTRDDLLSTLKPGDRLSGTVTNLCHFGVFVDLGGVEGLIHISELSWGRVRHPSDVLQRGREVQVYVLEVAPDEGRVALSLKRLQPDPWKTVEERYQIGQTIEGEVTHVVDFGAFVCVEAGLEGLIHISELAEGHFLHPYNVVKEGDTVQARILHIDGKARRLGLSLRR
ncbi:MAG: S1 RNA-binding domain-containing protein [Chloroflexi bacterium]|nr:S1 RNA-binding domain-containing protein [Chloroflexota bacterium]